VEGKCGAKKRRSDSPILPACVSAFPKCVGHASPDCPQTVLFYHHRTLASDKALALTCSHHPVIMSIRMMTSPDPRPLNVHEHFGSMQRVCGSFSFRGVSESLSLRLLHIDGVVAGCRSSFLILLLGFHCSVCVPIHYLSTSFTMHAPICAESSLSVMHDGGPHYSPSRNMCLISSSSASRTTRLNTVISHLCARPPSHTEVKYIATTSSLHRIESAILYLLTVNL
jgi:hypothetical protein